MLTNLNDTQLDLDLNFANDVIAETTPSGNINLSAASTVPCRKRATRKKSVRPATISGTENEISLKSDSRSPAVQAVLAAMPTVKHRVSAETFRAASEAGIDEAAILRDLKELESVTSAAKQLYARRDEIEQRLLKVLRVGDQIALPDNRVVEVVDNFWDKKLQQPKNVCWGHGSVRRFEIDFGK